jgi:diamine N-acetyltransferase
MLRLEKVNGKNVWEFLKLRVSDDQKGFVASNDTSIIEAYTAITGNGYAFPFGIYDEDILKLLSINQRFLYALNVRLMQ